jgi:hypothetical protein
MPITVQVNAAGVVSYRFPFPTASDPGASFGTLNPGVPTFFPVPIGTITKFKRVYALEGVTPNEIVDNIVEREGLFLPAKSTGGYRVLEKQNYSIGLSLNTSMKLVTGWMGLGFSGGVAATYGKGYLANRFAPNISAVDSLPKPEVPTDFEKLNLWNDGDSLSTSVSKSIAINAGLSVMSGIIASTSVVGTISTSWNVGLSKVKGSGKHALVKLIWAKEKGAKAAFNAGNFVANFSLTKAWGKTESFSYIFDLTSPARFDIPVESYLLDKNSKKHTFTNMSVLDAYQEAINGNLILADAFAAKSNSGVKKVNEDVKKSITSGMGGSLTVPFLMKASTNIGKQFVGGRSKIFGENRLLEELLASYSKESGTEGILSNDMKRLSIFAGNFQQITPLNELDGQMQRRYSASYKYYYNKNNVSPGELEEELRLLRYRVGFMTELKGVPLPKEKMRSLEIELNLSLSNYATDELMKIAEIYPEETFINNSLDYIDGFFQGVADAKAEICEAYRMRILQECIFTTKRQTKSAMKSAIAALKEMKKSRLDMDFKNFVKSYAEFGKGFIENRFTMKTFLRMMRSEFNPNMKGEEKYTKNRIIMVDGKPSKVPYEIILKIKGSNIAPVEKILYTYK